MIIGQDWSPSDDDIVNWQRAFPFLDIKQEVAQIQEHTEKKPIADGAARQYILRWFRRRAELLGKVETGVISSPLTPMLKPERQVSDLAKVRHKLTQTLDFYGKSMKSEHMGVWLNAIPSRFTCDQIIKALETYVTEGKFAPKPADVIPILERESAQTARVEAQRPVEPAPPHVARAWGWYIAKHIMGSDIGPCRAGNYSEEEERDMLNLVLSGCVDRKALIPEHREVFSL